MKSKKETLKFLSKVILGAGLVFYVIRSEMVDFSRLQSVIFNPLNFLLSIGFLFFSALSCATRWFILAKIQGLSLSFSNVFELTMIGNFFNTFMPGSVGGDVIKAWYIAGQEPTRKTKAIFTVLLDRLIGLAVIIFYGAITLLFYRGILAHQPQLRAVAISLWIFTSACFVGGIVFFSPLLWQKMRSEGLKKIFYRFEKIEKIIQAATLYRHHLVTVFVALLLSTISILGITLLYSIQGGALGIDIALAHYFLVVPIGLVASAVPLLPGGIGVGQVAFFTLFQWTGIANPEQGGTLCTLMQVYTILFNCVGAFFYLKYRRKPQSVDLKVPASNAIF